VLVSEYNKAAYIHFFTLHSGIVNNLSDDEIIALRDAADDVDYFSILSKYILHISFLVTHAHDGPHPTFHPTSIALTLDPVTRDVLRLVQSATTTIETGRAFDCLNTSSLLRYSTVMALGEQSHRSMLNENFKLKVHQELRQTVASVNISHIDGTMNFSLEEGKMHNSNWRVCVADKEHSSMPVNCIKDSTLDVSGTQWGYSNQKWTSLLLGRETDSGLCISHKSGVFIFGIFN
jgi:hypothetical protein